MSLEKGMIDRKSAEAQDRFIPGVASAQKGIDRDSRTVDGVASTINIDRDGESILPSAFKARAQKFLASNSPFAAAHTHRSPDGTPTQIGWIMGMDIDSEKVGAKFQFAKTNLAEEWWKLASDPKGKGIAFSIGFIPMEWASGSVAELSREFPEIRQAVKAAGLADDDRLRVYTDIELLEISGVMAPSNRESLQLLSAKMFGREKQAEDFAAAIVELMGKAMDERMARVEDKIVLLNDRVAQLREAMHPEDDFSNCLSPEERGEELPDPPSGKKSPAPRGGGRGGEGSKGGAYEEASRKAQALLG